MTFDDLPASASVFVEANPFIYHCTPEPTFGAACRALPSRQQGIARLAGP